MIPALAYLPNLTMNGTLVDNISKYLLTGIPSLKCKKSSNLSLSK